MTHIPIEIPPHEFADADLQVSSKSSWHDLSPGTGGNMHALGLPPSDPNTLWVGTDDGGINVGKRGLATGRWTFGGAHRGLFQHDIADIFAAETSQGAPLVYCIAGTGVGAGDSADLRVLFRRVGGARWEPIELASATHVWLTEGPPTAPNFNPVGDPDKVRTLHTHLTPPSFVRVVPLPGAPGRHLLVIGGNTGTVPFDKAGRIGLSTATTAAYEVGKDVFGNPDKSAPYVHAPNFYCCLAEALDPTKHGTYGPWVGATYQDEDALWAVEKGANDDPNKPELYSTDRCIAYSFPTGIGSLWLEPTKSGPVHLYFTIRMAQPGAIEVHRIVRMTIQVPTTGLELSVPQAPGDAMPISLKDLYEAEDGLGLCQVTGVPKTSPLQIAPTLYFTTTSLDPKEAVFLLSPPAKQPIAENLPLGKWYNTASWPDYPTFFFAKSNDSGWVYVTSCNNKRGAGLWARDPNPNAKPRWRRLSFLTGGADPSSSFKPAGTPVDITVEGVAMATKVGGEDPTTVASLEQKRPLQLALGYRGQRHAHR